MRYVIHTCGYVTVSPDRVAVTATVLGSSGISTQKTSDSHDRRKGDGDCNREKHAHHLQNTFI